MNWFDLLLIVSSGIGLAYIVVDGSVFNSMREFLEKKSNEANEGKVANGILRKLFPKLHKLVNCYQCSGFWTGVIMSLLILPPASYSFGLIFASGLCVSWLSMLGMAAINFLDR